MTLLDAQAVIALMLDEPAADEVEAILRKGDSSIASVNLMEVIDRLHRVAGIPMREVTEAVGTLVPETIRVVDVTVKHALLAAEIRARRYHRTRSPLSLADCVAIAVAADVGGIASADGPLLRAARAEGLSISALKDSRGRRHRL